MKYCTLLFAALIVVVISVASANAQPLYWDVNDDGVTGETGATPGGSGDATGDWDSSTTNWNDDITGDSLTRLWESGRPAVFAAGGDATGEYIVTVVGEQTASDLTFEDAFVMSLAQGAGGQITLVEAVPLTQPQINLTPTGIYTINSVIGGTAGFKVARIGAAAGGTLELGGANIYSGDTRVGVNSILRLGAANAIPDTSVLVLENGAANTTFRLNGHNETVKSISNGGTTLTAAKIVLGTNTLTLADPQGETNSALFESTGTAGDFSGAHGTIIKKGSGGLTLNNANTTFTGGEFVLDQGGVTIGANNCFGTATAGAKLTINPNNRPEGVSISKTVGGAAGGTGAVTMNTNYVDIGGNFELTATGGKAESPNMGLVTWQWNGAGAGSIAGTPGQAGNGKILFTLKADNPVMTFNHGYSDNVGVETGHVILSGTIRDDGTPRGFTVTGGGTFTLTDPFNSYRGDTTITGGSALRLTHDTVASHIGPARLGDQTTPGTVNLLGGTLSTSATIGLAATLGPRQNIVANPLNMVGDNSITWTVNSTFSATPETNMDFVFTSNEVTGSGTLRIRNRGVDQSAGNTNNKLFRAIFSGSGNDFDYSGDISIENYDANGSPTPNQQTRKAQLVSNNTSGTQTWVGDISGNGSLKRMGADGTTVLNGANTYSGGTFVEAGTLKADGALATFGDGNITVSGGILEIAEDVLDAIDNAATLTVTTGGMVSLGSGVNEIIAALTLDSFTATPGTYGLGSGATNPGLANPEDYFTGTGILTIPAVGVPGDYNNDETVDAADYVMWRKLYPDLAGPALPNDDSAGVDTDDYDRWEEHFGESSAGSGGGSGASGQVPEPTGVALVLVALAVAGICRGQRGK